MKILFMGTPDFAVPSFDILNKNHDIIGAFTKVDKPNSRGKKVRFVPVKQYALDNEIEVYQPNSVKTEETLDLIRDLNPDLIVVVAYGKILPKELIDIPRYGVINVHSSILPKYRGAAPIHNAIINGDSESGVTIMYIAEELDAGDIIKISKTPIYEEDTLETLHDRLADLGAKALLEAVNEIEAGTSTRTPQDHSKATFVKPIKKEETVIDWGKGEVEVYNFVRGMNPFPCAMSTCKDKIFKIYMVEKLNKEYEGSNGEVVDFIKNKGPVVKVEGGSVILTKVKPQNKRLMDGKDIINGNYLQLGDKFEN
jgi:methionyl-tRNA formyltransferase